MATEAGDWIVGRPLGELRLRDEGILVLGVVRPNGTYVGAPGKETCIEAGDTVILYGRDEAFADLAVRPQGAEGEQAHHEAVTEQRQAVEEEATDGSSTSGASRAS